MRSYLLRVEQASCGETRFVVQDLRTGERHTFSGGLELQQFLDASTRPPRLR
jgi:hypothetical protein